MRNGAPARMRTATGAGKPAAYQHECHHGFCMICGSVWPCSRATRMTPRLATPIPRVEYIDRL